MQITIVITGSRQLKKRLTRIGAGMHDFSAAFKTMGDKMATYYQTQGFLSQGGVFGQDWPRLSRSYAVRKAKKYPGRPPLVASGKMLSGFRFESTPTSVTVGNRMPYFKYHQSTRKPRRKIPRRAMMGINDPIKRIIHDTIVADMNAKLRKA